MHGTNLVMQGRILRIKPLFNPLTTEEQYREGGGGKEGCLQLVQLCVTSPQDLILEDAVLDHKLTPSTGH